MKVAIIIFSDLNDSASKAKVYHALEAAQEFKTAGDRVDIIFDGAGVRAAVEISDPNHDFYTIFKSIESNITGICRFCSTAFGVREQAEIVGLPIATQDQNYHQHPSIRNFATNGYQVFTF